MKAVPDLPPWNPASDKDRHWFSSWTIEKVRKKFPDFHLHNLEAATATIANERSDLWDAIKGSDEKRFLKAIKSPHNAKYAFDLLVKLKQDRDQLKADQHGTPNRVQGSLALAAVGSSMIDIIHEVWLEHYGKWQRRARTNRPTAFEIASRLCAEDGFNISADDIEKYRRRNGTLIV